MSEASLIKLIDLPGVVEIERVKSVRGADWRPENDWVLPKIDELSIRYFGVAEKDTHFPKPERRHYQRPSPHGERFGMVEDAEAFREAEAEWDEYEDSFDFMRGKSSPEVILSEWADLGFDVAGSDGKPLYCLYAFHRQMIVAALELVEGANLSPTGENELPADKQGIDDWAAALERSAREFKRTK